MRYSLTFLALFIGVLFLWGCDSGGISSDPPGTPDPEPPSEPLRDLATSQGVTVGAAASADPLINDSEYAAVLAREFNALTPENIMKWEPLRPGPDAFDFEAVDQMVAFADEHDMSVRGHTLVWHQQLPAWLTDREWTREELITVMETHIETVVTRYEENHPGRIDRWDVVNEAISGTSRRPSLWQETIGSEYVALAFERAREVAPDADLYYNDYSIAGTGEKSDAVYDLVRQLVEDDVPIDGVGFQSHVSTDYPPPPTANAIAENMQRYEELGLDVAITELDVRIPLDTEGEDGVPSEDQLEQQADYYARFAEVCFDAPNCSEVRTWGFTDAHSWIPNTYEDYGAALLFDASYEPKPAYDALARLLNREN